MILTHVFYTLRVRPLALIALLFALSIVTGACSIGVASTRTADTSVDGSVDATLVVATHNSFALSEEVVVQFEREQNVTLQFLQLGDAGEALNRLILSRDAPLADVFFGVDNTFLSRALEAGLFAPYDAPALSNIPDELRLDPQNRLLPVDVGFVNINADAAYFVERDLPIPQTLDELTDSAYTGLLVVQNPATSSPGLAFLLTTIAHFGEDGYLDFWRQLRANDVLVVNGWEEAYYSHFTVGSGGEGDRPLVISYTTSPPADVLFAADERTEPASVNVSPDGATFRQIEFIGILQSSQQQELARAFVDFMLSQAVQEDIPLQMFVYPANETAALPDLFVDFAARPDNPAEVAPEAIEANREAWIAAWTDVMLR